MKLREIKNRSELPMEALGFYQHMGFEIYKRTAQDEQGGPYPLLYMKRKEP